MKTTNEALDYLIKSKGYSFDEVAERMGISRIRLFQLRQAPYRMNILQMERLAMILSVPFDDIYDIHKASRPEE